MKLKYKILLVHNPFDKSEGLTYLSAAIRVGTNSYWNHIAIEIKLYGTFWIVEAVGEGVIITEKSKWLVKSNRDVLAKAPIDERTINSDELLETIGDKYGFLDLLHIAIYIIKRRTVNPDYVWDGEAAWKGWFCSELAAHLEGRENPHLVLPCDYESMKDLKEVERYKTYKKLKQ